MHALPFVLLLALAGCNVPPVARFSPMTHPELYPADRAEILAAAECRARAVAAGAGNASLGGSMMGEARTFAARMDAARISAALR